MKKNYFVVVGIVVPLLASQSLLLIQCRCVFYVFYSFVTANDECHNVLWQRRHFKVFAVKLLSDLIF